MDADIDEDTVFYLNPNESSYFFGNNSMGEYYHNRGFAPFFVDENGVDLYLEYSKSGDFIKVTEDIKEWLSELASMFGDKNPDAWMEFCHVKTGDTYKDVSWDEVGLVKTGEYQILYITENPMSMPGFLSLMRRSWLVHEKEYLAGRGSKDGQPYNDYNTADGKTMSFGPYKLKSITKTDFNLEKNENWYGWDVVDERFGLYTHEDFGDFKTVTIAIEQPYVPEKTTARGENHTFPFEFETKDLWGETVTHETLGEKEIFFVHLWGTWCPPCVAEMGELAEIAKEYSERVGFIALLDDFTTNPRGAIGLIEHNGVEFLNVAHTTPGLEDVLAMLRSGYVPTTIIIDGDGKMIGEQIIGSYGHAYIRFIEEALKEVAGR